MVSCSRCLKDDSEWMASISASVLGDECTETYYLCGSCGVYTKVVSWDMFSGEESSSISGPINREEGDAAVALIRGCSQPWNKKCRCAAHLAYFDGSLD